MRARATIRGGMVHVQVQHDDGDESYAVLDVPLSGALVGALVFPDVEDRTTSLAGSDTPYVHLVVEGHTLLARLLEGYTLVFNAGREISLPKPAAPATVH